jgi:hypothetical protein
VGQIRPDSLAWDHNLYFDLRGKRLRLADRSWTQWRQLGFDGHSVVADPGFVNPGRRRFDLKKNSPAHKIGFQPFDLTCMGPRRV